jgi:hypothetical protein
MRAKTGRGACLAVIGATDPERSARGFRTGAKRNDRYKREGEQLAGNRDQKLDHEIFPDRRMAMAEWEIVLNLVGDLIEALAVKGVVNGDDIAAILQGSVAAADLDGRSDLLDELSCIRHVTTSSCSLSNGESVRP